MSCAIDFRCWLAALLMVFCSAGVAAAQTEGLFDRLDANQDGAVSSEEVGQEHARLFQRLLRTSDDNNDGRLSREEFARAFAPPAAEQDSFRPALPSPEQRRAVQENAERIFDRLDRNSDGKLQSDELPQRLRDRLNQADGNNDGAIDRTEWRRIAAILQPPPQTPPTVNGFGFAFRLPQALDKDGDGELSAEEIENAPAVLARLDRNGDGKLSFREFGPVQPPPNNGAAIREQIFRQLRQLDKDGDRKISREEAPANLRRNFDALDANGDGGLDAAELGRLLARLRDRQSDAPGRDQQRKPSDNQRQRQQRSRGNQ